jgi:hypothetical protein
MFDVGEIIGVRFNVPIAEWANSGTTVRLNDLTRKTTDLDTSVVSVTPPTGGTVDFARFQAYSDSLGNYRLDYELQITGAPSATYHEIALGLGGATFSYGSAATSAVTSATVIVAAANAGAASIFQSSATARTDIVISGSAPLSGKPSWFDANAENQTAIDAQVDVATATVPGLKGVVRATSAYRNATTQTGLSSGSTVRVDFNAEEFDIGNSYDSTTNYRFQPDVAGYYSISSCARLNNNLNTTSLQLFKNGSLYKLLAILNNLGSAGTVAIAGSALVYLNGSSDYIDIRASGTTSTGTWEIDFGASAGTHFMAHKID